MSRFGEGGESRGGLPHRSPIYDDDDDDGDKEEDDDDDDNDDSDDDGESFGGLHRCTVSDRAATVNLFNPISCQQERRIQKNSRVFGRINLVFVYF